MLGSKESRERALMPMVVWREGERRIEEIAFVIISSVDFSRVGTNQASFKSRGRAYSHIMAIVKSKDGDQVIGIEPVYALASARGSDAYRIKPSVSTRAQMLGRFLKRKEGPKIRHLSNSGALCPVPSTHLPSLALLTLRPHNHENHRRTYVPHPHLVPPPLERPLKQRLRPVLLLPPAFSLALEGRRHSPALGRGQRCRHRRGQGRDQAHRRLQAHRKQRGYAWVRLLLLHSMVIGG
jgi:hypothetical protein